VSNSHWARADAISDEPKQWDAEEAVF